MDRALSASELDVFLDITFLFNSVRDIKMLSGRFLQMLGKLVPYEKAVFFLYHDTRQKLISCVEIRCEKTMIQEYIERYHGMDYLGWLLYQSDTGPVRESDKISVEEKKGTIFFKNYMKRYDIAHRLIFNIQSSEGDLLGSVMFFRSSVFEDFTSREVKIIQLLQKNFSAAVENALGIAQLRRSGALAQKVYHDITDAMLILTGDLEIREKNQQMERFLQAIRQEGSEDAFMKAVQTSCTALQEEEQETNTDTAKSAMVKVYHGTAKISMVPTNSILTEEAYEFVVVYSDASPEGRFSSEKEVEPAPEREEDRQAFLSIICARYGLTKREANLIELALEGLENKEIAQMLHISLFTVKSHFQNSYAKLGVKNRQELFLLYMNYNVSEEYRREFEAGTRKDEFW